MTRITVHRCPFLLMTGNAPAHALLNQRPGWRLREFRHFPMARHALDLSRDHVPTMREKDITGHLVHPLPRDLLVFCRILSYLLFFRILGQRGRMARHASSSLGQACKGLLFHGLMASGARQAHFTRMLLMVKANRLRTIHPGHKNREIEH